MKKITEETKETVRHWLKMAGIATLIYVGVSGCRGCINLMDEDLKARQKEEAKIQLSYKPLEEKAEQARIQRRQMNWTSPQQVINEDKSVDIYAPIEDLVTDGQTWTIYFTNPQTKEVKQYGPMAGVRVVRDISTNQQPYLELNFPRERPIVYSKGKTTREIFQEMEERSQHKTIHIGLEYRIKGRIATVDKN